jgi:hypothetical protein
MCQSIARQRATSAITSKTIFAKYPSEEGTVPYRTHTGLSRNKQHMENSESWITGTKHQAEYGTEIGKTSVVPVPVRFNTL